MRGLWGATLIASLVSSGAAGGAFAQPAQLRFAGFTYEGSGCPPGSVHPTLGVLLGAAVLRFDAFVVEAARGEPASKSCQVAIQLRVDPSWSFGVPAVHYRGSARLGAGASATQTATYYFQGGAQVEDARGETDLDGPFSGAYSRSDDMSARVWSPCGVAQHTLVIDAEISVSGGRVSLDSAGGNLVRAGDIVWKKCP